MARVRVGTYSKINDSAWLGSKGIQMFPVFGCTQNGDFSKWFVAVDTCRSIRGYR